MSVLRTATVTAAMLATTAVVGGVSSLLALHQLSATSARPANVATDTATPDPATTPDPTIMALHGDHDNDNDDDDDDHHDHGWGGPSGPKRGSDSHPADAKPSSPPGQTRERIEQRNDDQLQRDALNNRHIVDGPGRSVVTQRSQTAPEFGQGAGLPPATDVPAVALPPVPALAVVPIPIIAPPTAATPPQQAEPPRPDNRAAGAPTPTTSPPELTGVTSQLPESFRFGYPENLRSADVAELARIALPGVAGIFLVTAFGGLIGYRQAKVGHALQPSAVARFLQ